MVVKPWLKLFSWIARIVVDPNDDAELRDRKVLFVVLVLLIDIPNAIFQFIFYISKNETTPALLNIGWGAFDLGNIIFFALKRHNFYPTVRRVIWGLVIMPLFITISLGGIVASGAYLLFTILVPVGAAIFLGKQTIPRWTVVQITALIAGAILDPYALSFSAASYKSSIVPIVINMITLAMIISVANFYFISRREQALDALQLRTQELQAKNEELINMNRDLSQAKEEILQSAKQQAVSQFQILNRPVQFGRAHAEQFCHLYDNPRMLGRSSDET